MLAHLLQNGRQKAGIGDCPGSHRDERAGEDGASLGLRQEGEDGASGRPSGDREPLGYLPHLADRVGRVNRGGEQHLLTHRVIKREQRRLPGRVYQLLHPRQGYFPHRVAIGRLPCQAQETEAEAIAIRPGILLDKPALLQVREHAMERARGMPTLLAISRSPHDDPGASAIQSRTAKARVTGSRGPRLRALVSVGLSILSSYLMNTQRRSGEVARERD